MFFHYMKKKKVKILTRYSLAGLLYFTSVCWWTKTWLQWILFFIDIKKHTSDDNPDKVTLEKAIESLKEVMT